MKRKPGSDKFWVVLVIANLLALIVSVTLVNGAEDAGAWPVAVLVTIGTICMLLITDTISIVVRYL
jgi:hypothetical protein